MASALWGKVYCFDVFAGVLQQEPGGRYAFTYDASYLDGKRPAIAHTLPLQYAPHYCEGGLHPFFDNLVAEGWLRNAQARALGVHRENRFALLLAFGRDCAGAVSVVDPDPVQQMKIDAMEPEQFAALASRASLSGIQPKLFVIQAGKGFRAAGAREISTHLAKLPSGQLPNILEIEWLSTEAWRALLPDEPIVEMEISSLGQIAAEALIIRRFDRTPTGLRKLHFEEFNQLLGHRSEDKYNGSYEEMAAFIRQTPGCIPAEAARLFRRVLACLLIGNTDAHLKNFAMMHTLEGLRLAPAYDLLASSLYPDYQTVALSIGGATDLPISKVRAKHIVALGESCGLRQAALHSAVEDLRKRMDAVKDAINAAGTRQARIRDQLIATVEKRWNGTFVSIGHWLSKRRGTDEKRKG